MKPIFLLSLFTIFIFSCNGQNNVSKHNNGANEVAQISKPGQPKIVKTQGSSKFASICFSMMDKDGDLWFGTVGEGVYRYYGKLFLNYVKKDGLNSNTVYTICCDKKGLFWFGTDSGVCCYNGKTFTDVSDKLGFNKNTAVLSILEDTNGILWFGTTSGTCRYDGKSVQYFKESDGIYNVIESMMEDRAGHIWFSSRNKDKGGAWEYDGKTFKHYTAAQGLGCNTIKTMFEDKAGNIWFCTVDCGLWRYDRKLFTHLLDNKSIVSIYEDRKGNIWFGTDGDGLYCDKGGIFTNFTTKNGLANNSIFSIVEDSKGNLWLGGRNVSLCSHDGKVFTDFSEQDTRTPTWNVLQGR